MTHLLLALLLAGPARPKPPDYVRMLNADQQVIKSLTEENRQLKLVLYGPPGVKVYPRWNYEKPYCPVDGFVLQWLVVPEEPYQKFEPFCLRTN